MSRTDLHVHSTISDGSFSQEKMKKYINAILNKERNTVMGGR